MAIKRKTPLFMTVLFSLTGAVTVYLMYIYLSWMVFDETNVKMFQSYFAAAIRRSYKIQFVLTDSKYYTWVAAGGLLMIIKWAGSFFMFRGKPWGYIMYIIPNLLLLATMGLIMFFIIPIEYWTANIWVIGMGTFAFVIAYSVALVLIIKRKKAARTKIAL